MKKLLLLFCFLPTILLSMETSLENPSHFEASSYSTMLSLQAICLTQVAHTLFKKVDYDDLKGSMEEAKKSLERLPEKLKAHVIDETNFYTFPDWKTRTTIKFGPPTGKNFQYCDDLVLWSKNKKAFIHQKIPYTNQQIITSFHHDEPIHAVRKAPRAPLLATVSANHLFIHDITQPQKSLLHKIPLPHITAVDFSWAEDPILCVGTNQGNVVVFSNLSSSELEKTEETFTDPTGTSFPVIQALTVAPSGNYLMAGCENEATYVAYVHDNKVRGLDCFEHIKNIREIIISPSGIIACNTLDKNNQPHATVIFKYIKGESDNKIIHCATKLNETTIAVHHNKFTSGIFKPEKKTLLFPSLVSTEPFIFKITPLKKKSHLHNAHGTQLPCFFKQQYKHKNYYKVLVPVQLSTEKNALEKLIYKLAIHKAIHFCKPERLKRLLREPILQTFHQTDIISSFLRKSIFNLKIEKQNHKSLPQKKEVSPCTQTVITCPTEDKKCLLQ